jgi:HK97 family phage portal protein
VVDEESSLGVATAYRAVNIISDDIAKMPLQQFVEREGRKERVQPDARARNMAYLLEICPNLWGWTPFLFKKVWAQWLVLHGNAYVWRPPVWPFGLFILPADVTRPVFDQDGSIWYYTRFADGSDDYLPGPEVLHTLINPDRSGQVGRGVITFARESVGRQMGAYETESKLYRNGMNPTAYIQVNAALDKGKRDEYRLAYSEVMTSDYEGPRLAVFDSKIAKYETVSMSLVDAQFLELIGATDRDIANFFGMPLHMLKMGKEAYSRNEQKYLEYLTGTLDAYLVQIEQGARVKWLSEVEQGSSFWKFNRDALLRMDAKTRAETNEIWVRSGQRSPNEVREKDDFSPYAGGEKFYMTKNYASVEDLGATPAPTPPLAPSQTAEERGLERGDEEGDVKNG